MLRCGILGLLSILGLGCADPVVEPEPFRYQYVTERIGIDPVSDLGLHLARDSFVGPQLAEALSNLTCDGASPILLFIDGQRMGDVSSGTFGMSIGTEGSPQPFECASGVRFELSSGPDVYFQGPMFGSAESFDARINLSPIGVVFDGWTAFSGPLKNERIDAELSMIWSAKFASRTQFVGVPFLELVWGDGSLQPDWDEDGDGLERLRDRDGDGRVDRCIDGDGTIFDGADCIERPEIKDGFRVRVLATLLPAQFEFNFPRRF